MTRPQLIKLGKPVVFMTAKDEVKGFNNETQDIDLDVYGNTFICLAWLLDRDVYHFVVGH